MELSMKFSDEKYIVRGILYNEEVRKQVLRFVNDTMFHDKNCGDIITLITEYLNKYEKLSVENIELIISNNPKNESVDVLKEKIEIVHVEDVGMYRDMDTKPFLDGMDEWIRLRMFGLSVTKGIDVYSSSKMSDAGVVRDMMDESLNFTLDDTDNYMSADDDDFLAESLTTESAVIPTDWFAFNDFFGGGLKKKALVVIQGGVHAGKSRFLLSLSSSIRRASPDNNTLYVTLEMPKEDIVMFSGLHDMELTKQNARDMLRDDKEGFLRLRAERKALYGTQYVAEFAGNKISARVIDSLLEDFSRKGINIEAVFVDYIGLMEPDGRYGDSKYDRGINNSIELRRIPQTRGIPVITAVQPTRDGNRKNQKTGFGADMMDASESKGIPETSDIFMNLSATPEEIREGRQRLWIIKNRQNGLIFESFLIAIPEDITYRVDVVAHSRQTDMMDDGFETTKKLDSELLHEANKAIADDIIPRFD